MSQRFLCVRRIYQEPDHTLYISVQNINTGGTTSVLGTRVFYLFSPSNHYSWMIGRNSQGLW